MFVIYISITTAKYSWKKTRTRTSLMDRQARKLQIAREQQGYCEGNSTTLLNSIETSDGNSATAASAAGGTPTTGGFSTTGNRISDLTVLSDDDEKEVIRSRNVKKVG